jgi:hypothetical protein
LTVPDAGAMLICGVVVVLLTTMGVVPVTVPLPPPPPEATAGTHWPAL